MESQRRFPSVFSIGVLKAIGLAPSGSHPSSYLTCTDELSLACSPHTPAQEIYPVYELGIGS